MNNTSIHMSAVYWCALEFWKLPSHQSNKFALNNYALQALSCINMSTFLSKHYVLLPFLYMPFWRALGARHSRDGCILFQMLRLLREMEFLRQLETKAISKVSWRWQIPAEWLTKRQGQIDCNSKSRISQWISEMTLLHGKDDGVLCQKRDLCCTYDCLWFKHQYNLSNQWNRFLFRIGFVVGYIFKALL